MKIAIWGFGPYGRSIYQIITESFGVDSVPVIFDKNPQNIPENFVPDGMELLTPDSLLPLYRRGRFDEVIIGIFDAEIRKSVEQILHESQIPVLSMDELLGMLSSENLNSFPFFNVLTKLQDRESKDLYNARLLYAIGDEKGFLDAAEKYISEKTFDPNEMNRILREREMEEVILFGGGTDGRINRLTMDVCGIPVRAFCVLNGSGKPDAWPGIAADHIIGLQDLQRPEYQKSLIVISSSKEREAILQILKNLNIPQKQIYNPSNYFSYIPYCSLQQYFDLWEPREHEVFVDCGAFDGYTSKNFVRWCHGQYDAIYALEAIPSMRGVIESILKNCHDLTVISAPAGAEAGSVSFELRDDPTASTILIDKTNTDHIITVPKDTLDNLIRDRVTFIKMDIEGSELDAINGAQRLIRTWRPRLAISIYHQPLDFMAIPARLLELVPEYRFWIRHYGMGYYETVLYASAD